ncbi:MAG TPA: diversity-generating retroelement protein Avd [Myxococcota bacterium]|nr:diversity-generating retroelement protein Avd [Myxococcota bacterium]
MDEPVLLQLWERTVGELLDHTGRFPKSARFSFTSRIQTLALDILETLVRARWSPQGRAVLLARADMDLAVLRVLLRLSHDRHFLSTSALEQLAKNLDEAGRMLGGWRRSVEG